MSDIADIIQKMHQSPNNIRFDDLKKVCNTYFGTPRICGSHFIYKTPWIGDPRVNIQQDKTGKAKGYQVKQVLNAILKICKEAE